MGIPLHVEAAGGKACVLASRWLSAVSLFQLLLVVLVYPLMDPPRSFLSRCKSNVLQGVPLPGGLLLCRPQGSPRLLSALLLVGSTAC